MLAEFYSRVVIPDSVALELERGKAIGILLPDVHSFSWIEIRTPESMDRVPDVATLGAGEKEVLALGLQIRDAVVILDERLGRFYAESLKLQVTGTLGILLRARREGHITRVEPVLGHLKRLGFRLSAPTRESVLRLAGELDDAV